MTTDGTPPEPSGSEPSWWLSRDGTPMALSWPRVRPTERHLPPAGVSDTMLRSFLLERAASLPDLQLSCHPTNEFWLRSMLTRLVMRVPLRSDPYCPPDVVFAHPPARTGAGYSNEDSTLF